MRAKIYVAGPYTLGNVTDNVNNAISMAQELAEAGFAPFVPHLCHFWHLNFKRPYEFWMELDQQFLDCCDAVIRLPGESLGSDAECIRAMQMGKPVFFSIASLRDYYDKLENRFDLKLAGMSRLGRVAPYV